MLMKSIVFQLQLFWGVPYRTALKYDLLRHKPYEEKENAGQKCSKLHLGYVSLDNRKIRFKENKGR